MINGFKNFGDKRIAVFIVHFIERMELFPILVSKITDIL